MYVQILNPLDSKTHVSPKEAERLVYMGMAAYAENRTKIRYLSSFEAMRLRKELGEAADSAMYDRTVDCERGGETQAKLTTVFTNSGKGGVGVYGSPRIRTQGFELTLRWIAEQNAKAGTYSKKCKPHSGNR